MTFVLSSLKPDLNLLNSSFETYKLSLEKLPIDEQKLKNEVFTKSLDYNEYSLQHVKAYGIYNNLILDPWNHQNAYFISSDLTVIKLCVNHFGKLDISASVFSINKCSSVEHHVPSLKFMSPKMACISDGLGALFLIDTGDRTDSDAANIWEVILADRPLDDSPFLLKCVQISDSNTVPPKQFDCIVLSIHEVSDNESSKSSKKNCFNTHLDWLTYTADESGLVLSRHRRLVGESVPDYLVLEPGNQYIHMCSESPFHFQYDSIKEAAGPAGDETNNGHSSSISCDKYKWRQSQSDICLEFSLPAANGAEEVAINLCDKKLTISFQDSTLFEAVLYKEVNQENIGKNISADKLEVTLTKVEPSNELWPSLTDLFCLGNTDEADNVKREMDAAFVPDDSNPAYNVEQLEECDAVPENEICLYRLDGESQTITHQVNLGCDQYMFTALLTSSDCPCVCLRHDVDALIWEPSEAYDVKRSGGEAESTCWKHINIFYALGYVAASKEERKYSTCSPKASFAVLCDSSRRLFIYEQPKPLSGDGQLRNRKTGKCISDVATQRVITLPTSAQIEGCQANNHGVFVITKDSAYFIQMPGSIDE